MNEPNASEATTVSQPANPGSTSPVDESTALKATLPSQSAEPNGPPATAVPADLPRRIGRYRVERLLGKGAFGQVYLAHDDELHRAVAIKVPHRQLISSPQDVEAYLAEARVVASLDHPHIVPVYDVGRTGDGLCFVVSKFIAGSDLAKQLTASRPGFAEAAELVATVAEALHQAHRQGLVHRDIKPANILIDTAGQPHVADFGLALKEEDVGKGAGYAGTPAYMSPEQARGEGHRVDGRSDLFSLGVVLYELLSGRRPFRAETVAEVLEQVATVEARPPRQLADTIPRELERICLKALAKRASERYTTARDLADDLRHFLAEQAAAASPPPPAAAATAVAPASEGRPTRVVPKGLRSFDAGDADFFLGLLPGPRDRDGLPESLRFWKGRIEATDPDETFAVGLLYGPSGCGKSSLVKAGLLPRLAEQVRAVYVEATAAETEARILKGVRKRCPDLPLDLGLAETLAALRRGRGLPAGQKVLIVLDQFEQWLHDRRAEENTELVQALRQCDGERVQCLVLVRDDFWMAATRFLEAVEVRLVQGENAAAVDLFDARHARAVLTAFGRAFGALPEDLAKEQESFLDQAIAGLAQEGKVISVRLALFADMVKGRPWTPATLKEVGGTAGVGVTFLEETFAARTAGPAHRLHQQAARAVLKALLPEQGSDIKGTMRSHPELLEASGYAHRGRDFEELLRILDSEVRLISPTDPAGVEDPAGQQPPAAGGRYYQLTHDYLVPALRDWLTRKQKETRRGRAELRLAERAALWHARPESRHLLAWWEWLNIRLLTRKKDWTPLQRQLMRKAGRYHAVRRVALTALLLVVTLVGLVIRDHVIEQGKADHAAALVQGLLKADITQVPAFVREIDGYREWADPLLKQANDRAGDGSVARLHTSLALLPEDVRQVPYLYRQLLRAGPAELPIIRDALSRHRTSLVGRLWQVAEDDQANPGQRFRAACALALYDPDRKRWPGISSLVADRLLAAVQRNPSHYEPLLAMLRPVKERLLGPLATVFRSADRPETDRSWATSLLAEYAADRPAALADLLLDADAKQFAVLWPKAEANREGVVATCTRVIQESVATQKRQGAKERLARRQANAAVTLLRMDQRAKVWPLLKPTAVKEGTDPRVRSYLIHRFGPLGADPKVLFARLKEEPEVSVRRALLLALGEIGLDKFARADRKADRKDVLAEVWRLYREDPDPGLHGAAEWLLRRWQRGDRFKEAERTWAKDRRGREAKLARISKELRAKKGKARPRWYINGQGQTLVVIPGPVEFWMGSPPTEAGREGGPEGKVEARHRKRIGHAYAIAAREVTVAQFRRFRKDHPYNKQYSPAADYPINTVTWYEAAAYCNWLSEQEGIAPDQWCYLPNQQGKFAEGMKVKPNYLHLLGYRLPSGAEWEQACRAGAVTSRPYGEAEDLLGKYACYLKNSQGKEMLPVGSLKPNDLGLFDMLGNALEWTQEQEDGYAPGMGGKASEDVEDRNDIKDSLSRVLRGGSFVLPAVYVRSAHRLRNRPTHRSILVGFRPARTYR